MTPITPAMPIELRTFAAALDWRDPDAGALLQAFAGRFGAADDATLVIHAGAEADVSAAAEALGDESPDMVLVAAAGLAAVAPHLAAVLSTQRPRGQLAGLPWVAPTDLRSLYDLRLAGPSPRLQRFTCNICGWQGVAENRGWPRDTATCRG